MSFLQAQDQAGEMGKGAAVRRCLSGPCAHCLLPRCRGANLPLPCSFQMATPLPHPGRGAQSLPDALACHADFPGRCFPLQAGSVSLGPSLDPFYSNLYSMPSRQFTRMSAVPGAPYKGRKIIRTTLPFTALALYSGGHTSRLGLPELTECAKGGIGQWTQP